MPIIVDLYIPRSSWLHAADPRAKLLFVTCLLILLLTFKNLPFMLGAVLWLHLLHGSARIPHQKVTAVWRALLPVSLLMAGLWVVFYPIGAPIMQVGAVRITLLGLAQGFVLALRIIGMGLSVFLWLYTTDPTANLRGMVKMGMPFEWALALGLALRYIPVFQEMYGMIADAQQARGLNLSEGAGFRRVQTLMPILVALVISSLRASEQLAQALEARAFGAPGVRRTYQLNLCFHSSDYIFVMLVLFTTVGLLILNVGYGVGTQPFRLV